jgi:Uma2 family endonuclease
MSAPKRRATYEDLMQVPDTKIAEIIDGELIVSPRPATPHAATAGALFTDLGGFGGGAHNPRGPGGWWILFEPELHLGEDVLVPDFAAWRHERMPRIPNVVGITLAPDWVCEVISPSTGRIDRSRKMRIYARESVGHLWLVDPLIRLLEVYRSEVGDGGERQWVVAAAHGADERVCVEPFAAVELALERWWVVDTGPAR